MMYGQPMSVGGTTANNQKLWWSIFPLVASRYMPSIQLKDWTPLALGAQHQNIPSLSHVGAYTQYSDMHQMGLMLSKFSKGLPWESNSNYICQALQSKQLTASQMLAHAYLHHA
ncbi:TPA: hypothetical protein ACH3X1_015821 [Trebouxia sp. C0004]